MPLSPPDDRRGFEIAIICALPLEAECVQATFDQTWRRQYGRARGDTNAYTTGSIGAHNVVLAHMPDMGKVSAASVAACMRFSFTNIKFALVVGICGGVPFRPGAADKIEEITLGDVIISEAICQYDLGKQYPDAWDHKEAVEEVPARPSQKVRSVLSKLKTTYGRQWMEEAIRLHLKVLQEKLPDAAYPPTMTDRLYEPSYLHKHRASSGGTGCPQCDSDADYTCTDAHSMMCDELGCESSKLVPRQRLVGAQPVMSPNARLQPQIHFGKIGSADTVMKSGIHRDQIAQKDGLVAFEMEGAGVWDQFPNSLVIKGVCDYADSHKNNCWQYFAAATAAACMKSLLEEWSDADDISEPEESWSRPLWHMPFTQTELSEFVGRQDKIQVVASKLFQPHIHGTVALSGLGGVGKSRLAMEIAYRTNAQRPSCSILWVEATDTLTLERDYLAIGRLLNIQQIEEGQMDIKELVQRCLSEESAGEWLLVVDAADDGTLWGKDAPVTSDTMPLSHYLPKSPTGSILITTRNRKIATYLANCDVVDLYEMDLNEAEQTLRNLLGRPEILADHEGTKQLLNRLTCLPLAVVQASSYLNENNESVKAYLHLLDQSEDNVIKLLSENFNVTGRYKTPRSPVATTWFVSFKQIRDQSPLAADYLAFMSCLSEKSIPQSLLPPASSAKEMVDALGLLRGYSFLRKHDDNPEGPLYDMHRLVRLATRNWLHIEKSISKLTEKAIKQAAGAFPDVEWRNKDAWVLYLPHAQVLCNSQYGKDLPDRYHLLLKVGCCLEWMGKFDEAVEVHSSVVQWREEVLGQDNAHTDAAYHVYAGALRNQGRWTEAEKYAKRALEWRRTHLGPEQIDTLASLSYLALIYLEQGRWKESEELHWNAVNIGKKVLDPEHHDILINMSNLALTIYKQGRWKEAEELGLQVVEARKRLPGLEHPDTLTGMANLAGTYREQRRYKEAEEIELQVLAIRRRTLGPEHSDTLSSMSNLAATYCRQGRVESAEDLDRQVLEVMTRVRGKEHPQTLNSMENLSHSWDEHGRLDEAIELLSKCIKLREKVFGRDHPRTKQSKASLERWRTKLARRQATDVAWSSAHLPPALPACSSPSMGLRSIPPDSRLSLSNATSISDQNLDSEKVMQNP